MTHVQPNPYIAPQVQAAAVEIPHVAFFEESARKRIGVGLAIYYFGLLLLLVVTVVSVAAVTIVPYVYGGSSVGAGDVASLWWVPCAAMLIAHMMFMIAAFCIATVQTPIPGRGFATACVWLEGGGLLCGILQLFARDPLAFILLPLLLLASWFCFLRLLQRLSEAIRDQRLAARAKFLQIEGAVVFFLSVCQLFLMAVVTTPLFRGAKRAVNLSEPVVFLLWALVPLVWLQMFFSFTFLVRFLRKALAVQAVVRGASFGQLGMDTGEDLPFAALVESDETWYRGVAEQKSLRLVRSGLTVHCLAVIAFAAWLGVQAVSGLFLNPGSGRPMMLHIPGIPIPVGMLLQALVCGASAIGLFMCGSAPSASRARQIIIAAAILQVLGLLETGALLFGFSYARMFLFSIWRSPLVSLLSLLAQPAVCGCTLSFVRRLAIYTGQPRLAPNVFAIAALVGGMAVMKVLTLTGYSLGLYGLISLALLVLTVFYLLLTNRVRRSLP